MNRNHIYFCAIMISIIVGVVLFICIKAEHCNNKVKEVKEVYETDVDVVRYKFKGCPTRSMSVIHFEYNGHTYLMFGDSHIVHDPDCSCHNHSNEYIEY